MSLLVITFIIVLGEFVVFFYKPVLATLGEISKIFTQVAKIDF